MMCRDVELVGKKVGWELGGAVFGGHPRVLVGSGKGGDGVGGEPVRGQLRPARLTSHAEAGQSTHGGGQQTEVAHRLPNVFPHRGQPQAKGFSLVWVLSCLWTCSTRLI